MPQQAVVHSMQSSTLSDVLERVLDKGIVIAGDIKIKLVDIELLSIQIRLVICSVDKAKGDGHGLVGQQPPSFAARHLKGNWRLHSPRLTRGWPGSRLLRCVRRSRLEGPQLSLVELGLRRHDPIGSAPGAGGPCLSSRMRACVTMGRGS